MKPARYIDDIYTRKTQQQMCDFYDRLCEKEKRCYAAIESAKLGHGGLRLISELLGCSQITIRKGLKERENPPLLPDLSRIRHEGGGRKALLDTQTDLEQTLDTILAHTLAGDPMNADIIWTHLSASQIQSELANAGFVISENTVRNLIKKTL